jgi:hypothetical protein
MTLGVHGLHSSRARDGQSMGSGLRSCHPRVREWGLRGMRLKMQPFTEWPHSSQQLRNCICNVFLSIGIQRGPTARVPRMHSWRSSTKAIESHAGAGPAAPKTEGPSLSISKPSKSRSGPEGLWKYVRKVQRTVTERLYHLSYVEMLLTLRMAVRCTRLKAGETEPHYRVGPLGGDVGCRKSRPDQIT